MEAHKNSKDRSGITTGSVATAASLAALLTIEDNNPEYVEIQTPTTKVKVKIEKTQKIDTKTAKATVEKPNYDDPDITRGIEIISQVTLNDEDGIVTIKGGKGVGLITKPGLQIPVGEHAINPVPRDMIKTNLKRYLPKGCGATVTIIIPEGEKLAPKTMNPRLGIVGGISVLGTTGIARPMSLKAYKDSLRVQLDVAVSNGYHDLLFVPGNIGTRIAQEKLIIDPDQIIEMSNYVGYMLDEAEKLKEIKSITLFGHAGKLIKIAAGIFNTKQSEADARREIMTCYAALCGANQSTIHEIFECITTEDVIKILDKNNLTDKVFEMIADEIVNLCELKYDMKFYVTIVKMNGDILTPKHAHLIPFTWKEN